MNVERSFLALLLCLCAVQAFSQPMVVNDPKANATLLKQMSNGMKTLEQTSKTATLLESQKEMFENVNSAIKTLGYISEMSQLTKQILDNSGTSLKQIQATGAFGADEMATITGNYSSLIQNSTTIMQIVEDLLSSGIFKMGDAERFEILRKSREELQELLVNTRIARQRYIQIAEKRLLREYLFKKGN